MTAAMATNCTEEADEKDFTCGLYDFLIETVLMGTLCAFGFVGNLLSAVCLWKDNSKSATPFLLVSLELADTLFLVTVLLLRVVTSVDTFTGSLPSMIVLTSYFGKYVYPLAMIAGTGTIYLTVLVTVNRYISVCKPYDASSLCSIPNARKQVVVVWLFSIIFNIPRFFQYEIVEDCQLLVIPLPTPLHASTTAAAESEKYEIVWRLRASPTWLTLDPIFQQVYANVLYFLFMFLVPLLSLIVLNYNLIMALRETRRKRENMRSRRFVDPSSADNGRSAASNINSRSEDDITLMLIVVVVIFVVSQSPALVTQTLGAFLDDSLLNCPNYFFFYVRISDLLVVANSSVNFIAYCFCSRRFRKILLALLRGRTSDAEIAADVATETNTQTVVDRGRALICRNSNHDVERSSAKKSLLHRMTKGNLVKTKNFALNDIKELQEREPIV